MASTADGAPRRASKITLGEQPYWSVGVAVAEFLREDPREGELRQQMAAALRAVCGVENVWEDDSEVWGVTGTPSGEALVRAAADVVDHLAARAKAYIYDIDSQQATASLSGNADGHACFRIPLRPVL